MTTAPAMLPEVATPEQSQDLAKAIEQLRATVAKLSEVIANRPRVEPMLLRADEVAEAIGVDRRTLQRLVSAGTFPKGDIQIGRCPAWSPETVRRWIKDGGRA